MIKKSYEITSREITMPDISGISYTDTIIKSITNYEGRISWNDYFMSMAFIAASRSDCKRLNVGCVLVKNNRIISMGYNGYLSKAPHESIIRDNHEQATVHAEQNAISDAAKRGISVDEATAYITHYPCINCCKILCASGIKSIKYHLDYKKDENVAKLLCQIDIPIMQY
jgi:dCMP deaminase